MPTTNGATAADAGTVDIGGDITVNRLGFGAMRITGRGISGRPADRNEAGDGAAAARRARRQLHRHRRLVRAPKVSEELIAEALHPVSGRSRHCHQRRTSDDPAPGGGIPTADPSTCARPVKAACDACGWTRSRCTSSTGPDLAVSLEDLDRRPRCS